MPSKRVQKELQTQGVGVLGMGSPHARLGNRASLGFAWQPVVDLLFHIYHATKRDQFLTILEKLPQPGPPVNHLKSAGAGRLK